MKCLPPLRSLLDSWKDTTIPEESSFLGINNAELAHVLFASSSKLRVVLFAIKACPASQMSQLEGADHSQLVGHKFCSVLIFPANTSFYFNSSFEHFWSDATALIPGIRISSPLVVEGRQECYCASFLRNLSESLDRKSFDKTNALVWRNWLLNVSLQGSPRVSFAN